MDLYYQRENNSNHQNKAQNGMPRKGGERGEIYVKILVAASMLENPYAPHLIVRRIEDNKVSLDF